VFESAGTPIFSNSSRRSLRSAWRSNMSGVDFDPAETARTLLEAARPLRCAWLHVIRSPLPTLDAAS
jgi:hypothetical protein